MRQKGMLNETKAVFVCFSFVYKKMYVGFYVLGIKMCLFAIDCKNMLLISE